MTTKKSKISDILFFIYIILFSIGFILNVLGAFNFNNPNSIYGNKISINFIIVGSVFVFVSILLFLISSILFIKQKDNKYSDLYKIYEKWFWLFFIFVGIIGIILFSVGLLNYINKSEIYYLVSGINLLFFCLAIAFYKIHLKLMTKKNKNNEKKR